MIDVLAIVDPDMLSKYGFTGTLLIGAGVAVVGMWKGAKWCGVRLLGEDKGIVTLAVHRHVAYLDRSIELTEEHLSISKQQSVLLESACDDNSRIRNGLRHTVRAADAIGDKVGCQDHKKHVQGAFDALEEG